MVGVVELGRDPDILSLGSVGVAENLVESPANLLMILIGVSTVNVSVPHFEGMLHSLLNLICSTEAYRFRNL